MDSGSTDPNVSFSSLQLTGHVTDSEGFHKAPSKRKVIVDAQTLQNVRQLQSHLGLLNCNGPLFCTETMSSAVVPPQSLDSSEWEGIQKNTALLESDALIHFDPTYSPVMLPLMGRWENCCPFTIVQWIPVSNSNLALCNHHVCSRETLQWCLCNKPKQPPFRSRTHTMHTIKTLMNPHYLDLCRNETFFCSATPKTNMESCILFFNIWSWQPEPSQHLNILFKLVHSEFSIAKHVLYIRSIRGSETESISTMSAPIKKCFSYFLLTDFQKQCVPILQMQSKSSAFRMNGWRNALRLGDMWLLCLCVK